MGSSLLLALSITLWYFHRSSAGKIPDKINLPDQKYPALIMELSDEYSSIFGSSTFITLCPASTEREKRFNDEVSITGNSVFLRNNFSENKIPDSEINICDKLAQPVTLYDMKNRKYEIGYEVYYEEGKIQTEYYGTYYHHYKPVNINNEVINSTKNPSQYVVQSQKGEKTKFSFANESATLVFQWEPMLRFACSGLSKQLVIEFELFFHFEYNIPSKCEGYKLDNRDMNVYLVSDKNRFELWKDQHSYGDIEMSQIIPAWYFRTSAQKLASYEPMNMVPIWKSIADKQLKKVDIYLQSVMNCIKTMARDCWRMNVSFGISDVLEEPFNKQKMYFSDTEHHRRIPIPKIIYRLIEGGQAGCVFNAIIVIHNDPIHVSNSDRICTTEDEVSGWEEIKNDDRRTGLTYVCHYRCKKAFPSGKSVICTNDEFSRPLQLNKMSYIDVGYSGDIWEDWDYRNTIDRNFREILNKTSDTDFIDNVITKYTPKIF